MSKRILSLILSVVTIASMLTVMPVAAATHEYTLIRVVADETKPSPGDTINFTITMGPVSDLGTIQMVLDIPAGLTYVENSGRLAENLEETLGFDNVNWTECSRMINGGALYDCNKDTETVLGYFQCTVNDGFHGVAEVGLDELEFFSCETWEDHTDRYTVVPATIIVQTQIIIETTQTGNDDSSFATNSSVIVQGDIFKDPDDYGIPVHSISDYNLLSDKIMIIDASGNVVNKGVNLGTIAGIDLATISKYKKVTNLYEGFGDITFTILEAPIVNSYAKKTTGYLYDSLKYADVIGDDEAITTADAMVINSLAKNAEEN